MSEDTTTPILLKVPEAAAALRVGRTTLFALLRSGALRSISIGKRRLIAASEIERFVESLSARSDR